MQINEIEPVKVFHFFSELSKIPHGSGNTKAIAEYCLNFAKERGLESFCDSYGNVMIFKDGTRGYEQSNSIILQGHLDMVCEKRPDCQKNLDREGIDIVVDGDYLRANGTTLGGDDGIAVAYILALLDDDGSIPHPPIEALFTADEEIGLRGANALDASRLKGRQLINIDSEVEGVLTVSCAGGVRIFCNVPVSYQNTSDAMCAKRVSIGGLLGGHSGIDIGRNRKNAIKLLAEFLFELKKQININIADFILYGKLNVIPHAAEAVICINKTQMPSFDNFLADFRLNLKSVCAQSEPDVLISAVDAEVPDKCLDKTSSTNIISSILLAPNGVSAASEDIPFLVLTSSNLGSVSIQDGQLNMGFMIRSNIDCGLTETVRHLTCLMDSFNGKMSIQDSYPAWAYRRVSPLRDVMVDAFEEMYGHAPQICAIHAGLECGILAKKLDGADMISIGPNMQHVHTPAEQLEIKSVQRCWVYLLRVLEKLK